MYALAGGPHIVPQLRGTDALCHAPRPARIVSPELRKSLSIEPDELRQTGGIGECGWFELLQRTAGETYIAKGWTILTHRREPADGIALAYEEADGSFTIFTLAMVQRVRPALAQAFR